MPGPGGNGSPSPLSFTRRSVEASARTRRSRFHDANPHRVYRLLRGQLTTLREGSLEAVGDRSRDLTEDAPAADRAGAYTGRLQAHVESPSPAGARVRHRPWGPQGALLVALGVLVGLFGPLHAIIALAATALGLTGIGLFAVTREAEIPLVRRDVVTVLLRGEAAETEQTTPEGSQVRLAGEADVHYGGEPFLRVDEARVGDLGWPLRAELANRCARWQDPREAEPRPDEVATSFLDALRAWTQLDPDWTRQEIDHAQHDLQANLPDRQAYAEVLAALRPTELRSDELARLEQDLAALAEAIEAQAGQAPDKQHRSTATDPLGLGDVSPPGRGRAPSRRSRATAGSPHSSIRPPPRRVKRS